jgi:hypothetical protein
MNRLIIILVLIFSFNLKAEDPPFPLKYCAFNSTFIEGRWAIKASENRNIGFVDIKINKIEGLSFMIVEMIEYDSNLKMISRGQGLLSRDKKSISAGMSMRPVNNLNNGGYTVYIRNHCRNNTPGIRTIMTIEPFSDSTVVRAVLEIVRIDASIRLESVDREANTDYGLSDDFRGR